MSNYKSNHKKNFLAQKGQVAVIVALLIVCLMGMAALVVDVGSLYQKRASFQTVADSAALAGAQELPENKDDLDGAIRVAINYAKIYYNVDITSYDVEISTTYTADDTITVTPSDPVPVYFAGVLGINTVNVGAYAKAMVGEPKQPYYAVSWAAAPWAAVVSPATTEWWVQLVPGTDKYITTYKDIGSTSNFCAWNETSSLPPDWSTIYKDRIKYGFSSPLKIGDTIYVREIKMVPSSEIIDPTTTRGTRDGGTWDTFSSLVTIEGSLRKLSKSFDTQLVIVPVIEKKALGASATVLAFAPFILLPNAAGTGPLTDGSGAGTRIWVSFIDQALIVYDGEVIGVKLKGLRVIRLIR